MYISVKLTLKGGAGEITGFWHTADTPRATILFMPALGMPAGYYSKLGDALTEQGFNVFRYEQRGHGEHPVQGPSRQIDYGVREWVMDDLPVIIDWINRQPGKAPLVLGGHSLGAHMACCFMGLNPGVAKGFVSIAAAIPYPRHFSNSVKWQVRLLSRVVIPGSGLFLGYYPGDKIGFGGRESRTLMRDWNRMARTNQYSVPGNETDVEAVIAELDLPVLQIRMEDDVFAPASGADSVTDKFRNSTVDKILITADELQDHADHFRWARQATVVPQRIGDWWTNT